MLVIQACDMRLCVCFVCGVVCECVCGILLKLRHGCMCVFGSG